MTLSTPQGELHFRAPDPARLRSLRSLLPFGAVAFTEATGGASYGIVMKCGDEEAWCIKQQPPDIPIASFHTAWLANSLLTALSLRRYLEYGFGGCLLPCTYARKKGDQTEIGIAYFGAPWPTGTEAQEFPFENAFDPEFGHGFSTMVRHFIKSMQVSSKESGITQPPCIGLDHRPRSQLDSLGFGFLLHGRDLYCLKAHIGPEDPTWTALRATGITELYHLPSLPTEISPSQLPIAKPQ